MEMGSKRAEKNFDANRRIANNGERLNCGPTESRDCKIGDRVERDSGQMKTT